MASFNIIAKELKTKQKDKQLREMIRKTIVKTTIASNNFKKNEYISFIVKMKKLFMKSKNFMLYLLSVMYIIYRLIYQWGK